MLVEILAALVLVCGTILVYGYKRWYWQSSKDDVSENESISSPFNVVHKVYAIFLLIINNNSIHMGLCRFM